MLTYGPQGISRGIATIIFNKPGNANEALAKLNGMLVDKRPMRIEVVMDPNRAQLAKPLGERVAQPKSAAKSAPNGATNAARGGKATRGRGAGGRGRGGRRAKPKTADELDAEMADYFDPNAPPPGAENTAVANGAAPAANGGEDLGMDEIS